MAAKSFENSGKIGVLTSSIKILRNLKFTGYFHVDPICEGFSGPAFTIKKILHYIFLNEKILRNLNSTGFLEVGWSVWSFLWFLWGCSG